MAAMSRLVRVLAFGAALVAAGPSWAADQEADTMQGIFVPAGTPPEIIALLNREMVKALALPDVQAKCKELGFDVVANSPAEFSAYLKKEVTRWHKVIVDAKIPQIK